MPKPDLGDKKAFTRSEIYELIWRHTARDLSHALGCSDVLLNKACDKWNIPRPNKAVRGMLPKNTLGRKMLTKLKVYAGPDHPHQAQMPEPFEITQVEQQPSRAAK